MQLLARRFQRVPGTARNRATQGIAFKCFTSHFFFAIQASARRKTGFSPGHMYNIRRHIEQDTRFQPEREQRQKE